VLVGNAKKMESIQLHGAERVARVAKEQGVDRVVLMSAIGADKLGETP
jgi:NADH dehydrogenase